MDDKNIKEETLQEMEARLTKPIEYEVHPILTHAEEVAENKKLDKEIEELRAKLPVYRGEVEINDETRATRHKEGFSLTDAEYQKLNNTKWRWSDTKERIYDMAISDILAFSESGTIEAIFESDETAEQMQERFLREAVIVENQPVNLPSWME